MPGQRMQRTATGNFADPGPPEGAEGNKPTAFTKPLLNARFSPVFTVEQTHSILAARSPQRAPPRTFIFKLLHFRDRDLVLKEARALDEVLFENA